MNKEQILTMDPYMLLSIVNMKLRDEFSNLSYLCEDYDIEEEVIKERLGSIEYIYNEETNQFTSY